MEELENDSSSILLVTNGVSMEATLELRRWYFRLFLLLGCNSASCSRRTRRLLRNGRGIRMERASLFPKAATDLSILLFISPSSGRSSSSGGCSLLSFAGAVDMVVVVMRCLRRILIGRRLLCGD